MSLRARTVALAVLGAGLLAIEIALRGRGDPTAQVVGQSLAFLLFVPAAWLCWRGLGVGRVGLILVLLFAVGFRAAAFQPGSAPPLSTDLYRYAWDARVEASGANPYRYAPIDHALRPLRDDRIWPSINRPDWYTPYPPAAEGGFLLARGVFGHGARATTWLFLVAEAAAVGLLLLVLARAGAPLERVAAYAWHPLAVSEIAANGHVDALAVLALAALLAAWQARRFALAGAAVAIGALVRFGPALLALALVRRGGRRFALAAIGLVALGYLPFIWAGRRVIGSAARLLDESEFGSLKPLLTPHLGRGHASVLLGAALLAVLAVVALREHDAIEQVARSGLLVLGTTLLATPLVQPWYALWLLPFMVVVVAPGWLWLTGTMPLLYLYGLHGRLPGWVPIVIYVPVAAWILWRVAGTRRRAARQPAPLGQRPRIAAVLPALDEEEALPALLGEFPPGLVDEIIVVDGGSSDATETVARAAGAHVVREPRRGYGRACAAGAASTDAEVIVFLDGDGSDDPAYLPALLEPVLAGRAGLSLGARRELEPGALLPHQRLGNRLVGGLVRAIYGIRLHDVPPMRVVRRDLLERLAMREMTYGWPTEMIVKAARAGWPITEIAVGCRRRRGGSSKIAGRPRASALAGVAMLAVVARHS